MKDSVIQYGYRRMSFPPTCLLLEDDNLEVREQWPDFFNREFKEETMLKDEKGNPLKYVLFFDNDDESNNRYIKLTK